MLKCFHFNIIMPLPNQINYKNPSTKLSHLKQLNRNRMVEEDHKDRLNQKKNQFQKKLKIGIKKSIKNKLKIISKPQKMPLKFLLTKIQMK